MCCFLSLFVFACPGGVIDIDWSGDDLLASGSIDGSILIRDVQNDKEIRVPRDISPPSSSPPPQPAAAAEAAAAAKGGDEGGDLAAAATAATVTTASEVATLRWNADGTLLAIVDSSSIVGVRIRETLKTKRH